MSLLINDDLIWISIPRNASNSIERALYSSELEIKHFNEKYRYSKLKPGDREFVHEHFRLNFLKKRWKDKKTICIRRNWFERWVSGLEHLFVAINKLNLTPIIPYSEIDNKFIYDLIQKLNYVLSSHPNAEALEYFVKEPIKQIYGRDTISAINLLYPQEWWTDYCVCDYEFNVEEIWKFENFLFNLYGKKIKIGNFNKSKKLKNKVVYDNQLKKALYELLHKNYIKKQHLI